MTNGHPSSDRALERSDYYLMLGVGTLALLIRIIYLISYSRSPYWDALVMDPENHWDLARSVAAGQGMGPYAYFRGPLYIWLLSAFVSTFGESLWPVRIFQVIMGSMTAALTVRLGRLYLSREWSALAGLLMAVFWVPVYFDGELLITPFATFLNLAALITLILADGSLVKGNRLAWPRFLGAGLLFGLSAIARPNVLVFAVLVPFVVLLRPLYGAIKKGGPYPRSSLKAPLVSAGIFITAVAVPIAPVTIRNLVVADDLVLIASQGGINFWLGNHDGADGRTVVVPYPRRDIPLSFLRSRQDHPWLREDVWLSSAYGAEEALRKRVKESEISSYWYTQTFEWMRENPAQAFLSMMKKAMYLFQAVEVSNNRDLKYHTKSFFILRLLSPLHFGVIAPLMAAGLVLALTRMRTWLWPSLFFVCYALTVIAFFVTTRYRAPMLPVAMCLAALACSAMDDRIRKIKYKGVRQGLLQALPLMLMVLIFAVVSNANRPRWNDRPLRSAMHYNLGIALVGTGDLAGAENEFRESIVIKEYYPEARFWLGKVMVLQGRPEQAVVELEKSVEQAPAFAPSHRELYLLYMRFSDEKGDEYYGRGMAHGRIAHQLAPETYPAPLP